MRRKSKCEALAGDGRDITAVIFRSCELMTGERSTPVRRRVPEAPRSGAHGLAEALTDDDLDNDVVAGELLGAYAFFNKICEILRDLRRLIAVILHRANAFAHLLPQDAVNERRVELLRSHQRVCKSS